MADVAKLFPFRNDDGELSFRGCLDGGTTVSIFSPFRSGDAIFARGKNGAGEVCIGSPYRGDGGVLMMRSVGESSDCSGSCSYGSQIGIDFRYRNPIAGNTGRCFITLSEVSDCFWRWTGEELFFIEPWGLPPKNYYNIIIDVKIQLSEPSKRMYLSWCEGRRSVSETIPGYFTTKRWLFAHLYGDSPTPEECTENHVTTETRDDRFPFGTISHWITPSW